MRQHYKKLKVARTDSETSGPEAIVEVTGADGRSIYLSANERLADALWLLDMGIGCQKFNVR